MGTDDEGKRRVLTWIHKDEIDEGDLSIRMALLTRYPHVHLRTDLKDVHCYLFRRSILDEEMVKKVFSIREDLIPNLVKKQFGADDYYKCKILIADSGYCLRASSLSSLSECGKQLTRIYGGMGGGNIRLISQAAEIGQKTQIGTDSMIGDQSKIGEKSSVKRSIVGNYIQIGNGVKISNSIIMDYAVIEDYVRLEGCIIGCKAIIKEKSYLKDCDVGWDHVVEKESLSISTNVFFLIFSDDKR